MVSGEKRNCEGGNTLEKAAAILLDIEGATTSISFVKDTLFPYVRENLKAYVDSHWNSEEFKEDLKALKLLAKKDEEDKVESFCPIEEGENEKDSLIKNVLWQMDLDRKTTALKQLQGHIWREGYEKGKLKGHVYSDVPQVFKKWCEDDRKIYIYSSGSVEAQKLLFKNSEAGDLEAYITGHFDTEIGPKTEASSYANIAKAVGFDCKQILFLTDSVKEAVAADKAGLQVTIVMRDGNAPLTDDEKKAFTIVTSLKDLVFESCNKKKKICEDGQEAKAENGGNTEEETEKTEEIKNGESEKMEVDIDNEENPDSAPKSEDPEEKNEKKIEANEVSQSTEKGEAIVDDVESDSCEKTVTSSVEEKAEEASSNGKPEGKSTGEEVDAIPCDESTDSVPVDSERKTDEKMESVSKEEKPTTESKPEESTKEAEDSTTEEVNSVNGHEKKEEEVEENGKEANGTDSNEKLEVSESVPLKKMEEQADSTVEVTA